MTVNIAHAHMTISRDIYYKFRRICLNEDIKFSNLMAQLVTQYVAKYEQKHGPVVIGKAPLTIASTLEAKEITA